MGIVNRNTEYLIATTDGVLSCSTVRRLPDNDIYDTKCIDDIIVKYTDSVKTISRTAPIAIRFTPTSNEIAPDPHPIPTTSVPRAAYLKLKGIPEVARAVNTSLQASEAGRATVLNAD